MVSVVICCWNVNVGCWRHMCVPIVNILDVFGQMNTYFILVWMQFPAVHTGKASITKMSYFRMGNSVCPSVPISPAVDLARIYQIAIAK